MNLRPLIAEKNEKGEYNNVSLGRISFWICFGLAIYMWLTGTADIQASHLQMLYLTTTYNLMKKATFFGSVKTDTSETEVDIEIEEETPTPRLKE